MLTVLLGVLKHLHFPHFMAVAYVFNTRESDIVYVMGMIAVDILQE